MIVAIGCDQAGAEIKKAVAADLVAAGVSVHDLTPRPAVDYPDAAALVTHAISCGEAEQGVLVCGTGIGMSMSANKVAGIRAALCADPFSARMSREHNDANVLCLGGRTLGPGTAVEIVRAWLSAAPSVEERHVRRRGKVAAVEESRLRTPQ